METPNVPDLMRLLRTNLAVRTLGDVGHALDVIKKLYDVEREAQGDDEAALSRRHTLRQERSAPLLAELETWAREQARQTLRHLGKPQVRLDAPHQAPEVPPAVTAYPKFIK